MQLPACPIRGHAHALTLQQSWSEDARCWKEYLACLPKDCYRWIRANDVLAELLRTAPPAILRALKPEQWDGVVWIRRTRPRFGWPSHWEP